MNSPHQQPFRKRPLIHLVAVLVAVMVIAPAQHIAHAGETNHTCTGYISSAPATISTQGVWCVRGNLSTSIATGNAITIDANNVTLDCNGYKIGGLAAGDSSEANGVYAYNRKNATVRNCNIRGYFYGIFLASGSGTQDFGGGYLVEDNRLDNNLRTGIYISGSNNLVRNNRVFDTGGAPDQVYAEGIDASADVIDNIVAGVLALGYTGVGNGYPRGIAISGAGHLAKGNVIRDLVTSGSGSAWGIQAPSPGSRVSGNHVHAANGTAGSGIRAYDELAFCDNNTISGFVTAIEDCVDAGGNLSN